MKSVLAFWSKDIINKLIFLITTVLLIGAIIIVYLLFNMKSDSIFYEIFSPILGTAPGVPTMVVAASIAPASETQFFMPTSTEYPTVEPATIEPTLNISTATMELPTQEVVQPTATAVPILTVPVQSSAQAAACIPNNPPQTGKVLDVIDGNTIKVLIDGAAYTVRYIGIEVPKFRPVAEYFGQEADFKNAEYVFAKQVTLISDKQDKDDAGRLLRYVKAGDIFVNYELVVQGFASASSDPSTCTQVFQAAEQSALQLNIGRWKPTPTPQTP